MKEIEQDTPILIEWVDAAFGDTGWQDSDYKLEVYQMKSVGFLQHLDEEQIVIKQTYSDDDRGMGNLFVIPVHWIKRIKVLNDD